MPRIQMESKVSCEVGSNFMGKENLTNERNSASDPMEVEVGSVVGIPDIQPPDCNFLGFKAETDFEKGEENAMIAEEADDHVEENEKAGKKGEKEEFGSSLEEESSDSDQGKVIWVNRLKPPAIHCAIMRRSHLQVMPFSASIIKTSSDALSANIIKTSLSYYLTIFLEDQHHSSRI